MTPNGVTKASNTLRLTRDRLNAARSPTSATSEKEVSKVPGSEPWKTSGEAKYQYYPGGDSTQAPRDAPSALNTVIIPNVNLPKVRKHWMLWTSRLGQMEAGDQR